MPRHHHHHCYPHHELILIVRVFFLLSLHPSLYPSLMADPLRNINCSRRVDLCNSLLVSNTVVSMCRRPREIIADEFVITSLACFIYLSWMVMGVKWPYNCCFGDTATSICSKQHKALLCSPQLAFYLIVSPYFR